MLIPSDALSRYKIFDLDDFEMHVFNLGVFQMLIFNFFNFFYIYPDIIFGLNLSASSNLVSDFFYLVRNTQNL